MPNHDRFECQTAIDSDAILHVGSRVVSQEISTADEGDGGQVVVIGR